MQQLLAGGYPFPYVFGPRAAARPAAPLDAQHVQDFLAFVEQDLALALVSAAVDTLFAHSNVDTVTSFPLGALDADDMPLPITAGVAPGPAPTGLALGAPRPNPFAAGVSIAYVAPGHGRVRIAVFDAEGRRVATLLDGDVGEGVHEVAWNGRSDAGLPAPAGVYWVRPSGFGRHDAKPIAPAR